MTVINFALFVICYLSHLSFTYCNATHIFFDIFSFNCFKRSICRVECAEEQPDTVVDGACHDGDGTEEEEDHITDITIVLDINTEDTETEVSADS